MGPAPPGRSGGTTLVATARPWCDGLVSGPVWYWVRMTARQRRRAAVMLALLTVLATVVPLVAGAAARRTASSVERMRAELRPSHVDVQFDGGETPEGALEQLAAIPGVEIVAEGASILGRPAGSDAEVFQSFGQGAVDGVLGREFDRARLDGGRMPAEADEVMLARRLAEELGIEVGDTVVLETYSPEAIEQIFSGEPTPYDGPQVPLRVVGVGRQPEELTAGPGSPAPAFVVGPAFLEEWAGTVHWFDGIFLLRIDGGEAAVDDFTAAVRAAFPDRPDVAVRASEESARIEDAVATQATALALLAAVALLTGALAISQAAVRLARSAEADSRVLAALGLDRRQLGAARLGLVAGPIVVGAAVAAALAIALSGLFPNGPGGRVEPSPGIRVDALALAGGALVMLGAAVAATLILARPRSVPRSARPSRIGDAVGRCVPSLAATVGIQGALRRAGGPASAATRSAMVAFGAGVAGLVGALVFGSSLARLVDEPSRYGWNWDYEVALGDELTDEEALAQARPVSEDPRIEAAVYTRIASKDVGGRSTVVFGVEPLRGDLGMTIVAGRTVRSDDEVVLGRTTMDAIGRGIGDRVTVATGSGEQELQVVGQGLFPTNEADDPASGAIVTLTTMAEMTGSGGFPDVFVTVAPGVDIAELRTDLESTYGAMTGAVSPPVVSNLDLVDQAPYLLAGYLALLGMAASAHALVTVVRSRRTEMATLRSLGFERRQVGTTVVTHGLTVAAIGAVVGLPLGLALGRLTWRLVSGSLGFATDPRNPTLALLATPPGALALAAAIAIGPAVWAARQRPAAILRTE